MTKSPKNSNPAEIASKKALHEVYGYLEEKKSFLVEAGAGAGKTYTLIKALQFLINSRQTTLAQRHQKIACITFTNVAKDEIATRTDRNPLIYCDTIHAFCWSLISDFQKDLRRLLSTYEPWKKLISEVGSIDRRAVEYDLGNRNINDRRVSIHHDDVLVLTVDLMENAKFRRILTGKYPIILIDEYQDTNCDWVDAIKKHFLECDISPQFGFFGDHWQKIYGDGCGEIEHTNLAIVNKQANFRSVPAIVDCLNRMRPELQQSVVDPAAQGNVHIFHTNTWDSSRQTSSHWKGDLPHQDADSAHQIVLDRLKVEGWDILPSNTTSTTKILMLTHRSLARIQGYPSIPKIFKYNTSFTKKENIHIAYFADTLEPACEAYQSKKYGEMFRALGSSIPAIKMQADKKEWSNAMDELIELRETGTVANVLDHLLSVKRPRVPDVIEQHDRKLRNYDPDTSEDTSQRTLTELKELRSVPYKEIIALCNYLADHSPFQTKHGVKGAEFENVLVIVGGGWNRYDFNYMLELAADAHRIPPDKKETFERVRNLFYVTCSRPKKRLAILFTQKLSEKAIQTVSNWFGEESIEAI